MNFVSNSPALMNTLKQNLSSTFDGKRFWETPNFHWLGDYQADGIKITQSRYVIDLLARCGMESCNAVWSPLFTNADLTSVHHGDFILNPTAHSEYRSIIGALIHLSVCKRPDISFAVCALARHIQEPTIRHQSLLKRILRYISGTVHHGLHYGRQTLSENCLLTAYVDADWGGCTETRHSTTGFIIIVNGGPLSWKSQKQMVIALSSAESEYVAMSTCRKHITWLRRILWEVKAQRPFDVNDSCCLPTTTLFSDSTAAISNFTDK